MSTMNAEYNKQIIEIVSAHPKSWVVPLKREENKHLLAYVQEFTEDFPDLSLPERIYWTLNDMHDYLTCQNPGCTNKIIGARCWPLTGYKAKHCCNRCALLDPAMQEAARKRRLEKTGYEYGQQKPECRKHMSQVMKNKSPEEKKVSLERRISTCQKTYGVDFVSQLQENKDAVSKAWAERSDEEKAAITKQQKATKKDRYGDEKYVNAEKAKKTRASFSEEKKQQIEQKRRSTCMRDYGVPYAPSSMEKAMAAKNEMDLQRKKTFYMDVLLDNPFVEPLFSLEHFLEHSRDQLEWKCKLCGRTFVQAIREHQTKDKVVRCLDCFPLYENRIFAEEDIISYIKSFYSGEVVQRARDVIAPRELDIWIPEKRVAIEYNGVYWHSVNMGTSPSYHIEKTEECEKLGIHLLQIFENEWNDSKDLMKSYIRHAIEDDQKQTSALHIKHAEVTPKDIHLSFEFGEASLKMVKHDKKFQWHLKNVFVREDAPCSLKDAVSQLAAYCISHLNAGKIIMKLDRRFFSKKQTIGDFQLASVVKESPKYYIIKSKGTTFHSASQYSKLLEEAKGKEERVFKMVDCGQLVYVAENAKGATVK